MQPALHAAIRRERRPLPPHAFDGGNYRRRAAAVCSVEARHAADETHAFAALSWLSHLQAHESDRRGPWAAIRWNSWDEGQRRDWFARRRYLWSGFVRQVERYREARRRLAAASQPLAEISELVTRVTAPSSSGLAMPKNLATTAEPLCRSIAARSVKRS